MELPELHVGIGWNSRFGLYNEERCSLQNDELEEVARRSNLFPKLVEMLRSCLGFIEELKPGIDHWSDEPKLRALLKTEEEA